MLNSQIEQVPLFGDTDVIPAEEDVELGLSERRSDLVLDHFDPGSPSDHLVAVLDVADAADIHAHRGVEAEGAAPGRGFRIAEHHADLHAQLVDEDHRRSRLLYRPGQLSQRLRHQPRLQPHLGVPHLPFELGPRNQRRHGIDDDDVEGAAADQCVGDLEGFFAAVRLRDQQVLHVDPQLARKADVEGVLGVDECGDATLLLSLSYHVESAHRLAGRLGTVHLDDAPPGDTPDPESGVEREAARRDDVDVDDLGFTQAHDGPLPELLFHLGQGLLHRFLPVLSLAVLPGVQNSLRAELGRYHLRSPASRLSR